MYFKKHNCQAGTCKEEEDYIRPANISYQILQTLTDITDDEIKKIVAPAVEKLDKLTSDVSTMLDAFGAVKGRNLTPFQEALLLYPEMLSDKYCKRKLNDIKNSMVKRYHAGRLPVKGKYTFVIPDPVAICQNWFLHIDDPLGLLKDGEVSCRLYSKANKLDCLRSPHLYREHAVRNNVVNEETEKWFQTDAVYTSCKDLISKILQFDCDGDILLVVADETIIKVAERNMEGIVPLYYDMKKAEATILTTERFYEGMTAAWTGGNIGAISNDITKIWNSSDNIGDDELLAVKLLCAENNFVIDYAKTLYKPERPSTIDAFIRQYTKAKMPYFFMEAKGYSKTQVMPINNSFVNKLRRFIKKKQLNFKHIEDFDYQKLMTNPAYNHQDSFLIARYDELSMTYHNRINNEEDEEKYKDNIPYIISDIKSELLSFGYSETDTTDMLLYYLYSKDTEAKMLLWACFGDIMLNNLKRNINPREIYCKKCGQRFEPRVNAHKYCDSCFLERIRKPDERIVTCISCGKEFLVSKSVRNKKRCDECQLEENRRREREKKRQQRQRVVEENSIIYCI